MTEVNARISGRGRNARLHGCNLPPPGTADPMPDIRCLLDNLRRPGLLIRAASLGLSDYRRERDLRRLIGTAPAPEPEATLPRLLQVEEQLEGARQMGEATYSLIQHVEGRIARLGEARLLQRNCAL